MSASFAATTSAVNEARTCCRARCGGSCRPRGSRAPVLATGAATTAAVPGPAERENEAGDLVEPGDRFQASVDGAEKPSGGDQKLPPRDPGALWRAARGVVGMTAPSPPYQLRRTISLTAVNDAQRYLGSESPGSPKREGGGGSKLDDSQIQRTSMRLEGLESFSTLAALFTGFSLQLLSSAIMTDPIDGHSAMMFLVISFSSFGTLLALYATIVFALCSLYGKASLGLNNDDGYLSFITFTAVYREKAFLSLLASMLSLCATFMALLALRCPLMTSCTINAGVAYFCWQSQDHVRRIMGAAQEHVY